MIPERVGGPTQGRVPQKWGIYATKYKAPKIARE